METLSLSHKPAPALTACSFTYCTTNWFGHCSFFQCFINQNPDHSGHFTPPTLFDLPTNVSNVISLFKPTFTIQFACRETNMTWCINIIICLKVRSLLGPRSTIFILLSWSSWFDKSSLLLCLVRVWLGFACGNTAAYVCSCLHWAGGNWGSLALSSGALCRSAGAVLLLNATSHISLSPPAFSPTPSVYLFFLSVLTCLFPSPSSSPSSSSPSSAGGNICYLEKGRMPYLPHP